MTKTKRCKPSCPVSRSEFARLEGVSPAAITKRIALGMPILKSGKIDPPAARKWCRDNLRNVGTSITFAEARARKETAIAGIRELELAIKQGRYVDIQEVQAAVHARVSTERDILLDWPSQVAPIISADLGLDADVVQRALDKHVRRLLTELSSLPINPIQRDIERLRRLDQDESEPDSHPAAKG